MDSIKITPVARIRTDFPEKFALPRQGGMIDELTGTIVFEPEFARPEAVKGLESYTHIWVLWLFSENNRDTHKLTVRPPALGGNTRVGVFATRSPFRPNNIGLSCLKLESIENDPEKGPLLHVSGIDMKDGTPVIDIKPYIPMWDAKPEASEGAIAGREKLTLTLVRSETFDRELAKLPEEKQTALLRLLENDPRPAYQQDPKRIYGFTFAGYEIRFRVEESRIYPLTIEKAAP